MMRTKLLASGALAGTLVLASVGSAFTDGGGHFKDLAKAHFAESAIMMLSAEGLVHGVSQTKFEPRAPITLGQFAAILVRFQGKAYAQASLSSQVRTAKEDGLFARIGGDKASLHDASRAQAMAMIASALGLQGPGSSVDARLLGKFHDKSEVPEWAQGGMALGVQLGLVQGDQGDLAPQGEITRAELAVVLLRIEELLGYGTSVGSSTAEGTFVNSGTTTTTSGQTQGTITVSAAGPQPTSTSGGSGSTQTATSETSNVSPSAQIFYGNQTSTLANFKAGDPVFIGLDQDGQAAVIVDTAPTEVETQAGTSGGRRLADRLEHDTISAASGQGGEHQGNLPAGTYNLSSSVAVVLDGTAGSLSDVHQGDLVRLIGDASGQVTLIIVKAQAASVSSTVATLHKDWFALLTANGLVRVDLADQAQITRNGQPATDDAGPSDR